MSIVFPLRQAPKLSPLLLALTRISHQLSTTTGDKAASTSLRLLSVLDVLFKYASAR
jgi:hypothetical protein